MLYAIKNGQTSFIVLAKILDSSVSTGAGKTGIVFNSAGLIIATRADNEASATVYTTTGSTIETITTLGTYAAPTATKCRFKEVDATNMKGWYEMHFADARFAVSGAKYLGIAISGATGAAECDGIITLQVIDPYSIAPFWTTVVAEPTPAAAGAAASAGSMLYLIMQKLYNESITSTTGTIKKLDNSTTMATITYNDATNPTAKYRAT